MPQDTRIALFLLAELVAALRANDPDLFKRWLYGGAKSFGEHIVAEQMDGVATGISHVFTDIGSDRKCASDKYKIR